MQSMKNLLINTAEARKAEEVVANFVKECKRRGYRTSRKSHLTLASIYSGEREYHDVDVDFVAKKFNQESFAELRYSCYVAVKHKGREFCIIYKKLSCVGIEATMDAATEESFEVESSRVFEILANN
ncbi:MAG: hypothetical protein ACRC37_02155 [Lentisphaeria bacterium]